MNNEAAAVTETEKNVAAEAEALDEGFLAQVLGEPFTVFPEDLYIPPNALKVFLETFSGPLDLLLYLIKKQNIDILDIPVAKITEQYMEYIDLMQQLQLELAAEYLLMAAMLAEIKSKLLLPRSDADALSGEDDPRAELVRRLQEYERYKKAAMDLDALPRLERDIFRVQTDTLEKQVVRPLPKLELQDLLFAFKNIIQRAAMYNHHKISFESLSVRERMTNVLAKLGKKKFIDFADLFEVKEGKLGVVVTFIAMLELLRQATIEIVQSEPFGNIYLRRLA
jgi:segregation and condensation protein A